MYRVLLTTMAMKKHVKIIFVRFTNPSKIEIERICLAFFFDLLRQSIPTNVRTSKGVKEQIRTTA